MQKQNHSVFPKLWANKSKQFLIWKTKESVSCSELAEKPFVDLMYFLLKTNMKKIWKYLIFNAECLTFYNLLVT
jgi:hypothetical protein